jgi:hypothetical protein
MGSRALPLSLAAVALLADGAGLHRLAFYLVLLAVVGAAAAAFVAVADLLDRRPGGWARGSSCGLALVLLLLGSAVRSNAPVGGGVPTLAVSAMVGAVIVYALPWLAGWLFGPYAGRVRLGTGRVRTRPARVRAEPAIEP